MKWQKAPEWAITLAQQGQSKYGTPAGVTLAVAQLESSFNPAAVNKTSGAMGIMQVLPKYEPDYRRYIGSIDPALKNIDLKSQDAMLGMSALLKYNANAAVKKGIIGDDQWRWAVVAHRWGQNSEQIKTYRTQQRTLDVERLMKDNGCWYTGMQQSEPRNLKIGCEGDDVKALKLKLNDWLDSLALYENGTYDDATQEIVTLFQHKSGLKVDGVAGTLTQKALNKVVI